MDHNLTETQKIRGSYWRAPYTAAIRGFSFLADNPLTQLAYLTTYGMGIILNYSKAVRSNLVTTVGPFNVGNENDLYPAPAAMQAGAVPSIVANASQTPQFTFNANNSAPNALTTFGNLPFGVWNFATAWKRSKRGQ